MILSDVVGFGTCTPTDEDRRVIREPLFSMTHTALGVSGEAIIVTARLVEAPLFKEALEKRPASLGTIASTFIYETVIRHHLGLTGYSQRQVDVKESSFLAWMKLFGPPPSPSSESGRGVRDSRRDRLISG